MRSAAAATALGITLILASCVGQHDPVQPPGPDPSSTPVFASDEEALAAAEELYGRYVDISNKIGAAGWGDTSDLESVARGEALTSQLQSFADLHVRGLHQVGAVTFDTVTLQRVVDGGTGSVEITAYLCLDVSKADVVDKDGKSTVSGSRPARQPLEVGFDDADGEIKVNRSDAWSGQSFC